MARRRRRSNRSLPLSPILLLLLIAIIAAIVLNNRRHTALRQPQAQPTAVNAGREQRAATPAATITAAATPAAATPANEPTQTPIQRETPAAPAARATTPSSKRLALIIDDCGQWIDIERGFIALPVMVTMSVMPQERYTKTVAQEAQAAGKGVMLHLPMEPQSGANPGPGKITTAMTDSQITAQVQSDIAAVPLAKGVNNHEGSKATADSRVMRDVAAVLAADHLFFIDSRTSANSVASDIAAHSGLATASRDVFLDNVDDETAVENQLRAAIALAASHGSAIAIGHPRAATLAAVTALLPEAAKAGVTFVAAADLVH